jgi:hypothetical protein
MNPQKPSSESPARAWAINLADIVEANGKTILENNLEKTHDIPIGTLVEIKFDIWHGDGACEKTHARLWVVSHDRDCDGTPLYSVSKYKEPLFVDGNLKYRGADGWWLKTEVTLNIAHELHSGFPRESLTVIPVTSELIGGVGSLHWNEDEK